LQQLAWAGELQIPFTTGLLVGIGETAADRLETLDAIAQVHRQWGYIQEVIIQPYRPGQKDVWHDKVCSPEELVEVVAIARQILPEDITIQVPPNLLQNANHLLVCLNAGARDLGGIGPRDEVNPDYPHPLDAELANTLLTAGWQLVPRLPIYPQYDRGLAEPLSRLVSEWRSRIQVLPSRDNSY
jgi:FO synthase subunit 1